MAPSWKPAKPTDGSNYGKLVSAAAQQKSKRPRPVTPAPGGTNSGGRMTHGEDVSGDTPSPARPDPTVGRKQVVRHPMDL